MEDPLREWEPPFILHSDEERGAAGISVDASDTGRPFGVSIQPVSSYLTYFQ